MNFVQIEFDAEIAVRLSIFCIKGMIGTIAYNVLQLTVPYYSGKIVDLFLTGEHARENMQTNSDLFYQRLVAMVGITVVRTVIVYADCMIYEHVSQTVLYRIRNYLYDKIKRQDMTFYSTYRTGDLMTRVTGDLDAVRHMVAWVVRMVIESFSLFIAAAVFFSVYKLENGTLSVSDFAVCVLDHLPVQQPGRTNACAAA